MNNKQITTACGFAAAAMMLAGTPAIATTASNSSMKVRCLFVKTDNFSASETPSNYAPIQQNSDIFSVKDVIHQADKTLGLSKQHLATIFESSRQNLYNILSNTEQKPTLETEKRAQQVSEVLNIISSVCPYKLGASTLTVRIDGKRLFDVLTENTICLDQVKKFAEQINKRITQQAVSNIPEHIAKQEEFLSRPNAV